MSVGYFKNLNVILLFYTLLLGETSNYRYFGLEDLFEAINFFSILLFFRNLHGKLNSFILFDFIFCYNFTYILSHKEKSKTINHISVCGVCMRIC